MSWTRRLINTLWSQKYLRFYEIMHYPVPINADFYLQYSENDLPPKLKHSLKTDSNDIENHEFSREKKSKYMDEYLAEIKRIKQVFQSIPFVHQIFLCNSITFNALEDNSDIDLFIITQPWRIRSVKFRSMLFFFLNWSKRMWKKIRKKICLSFFITSDHQDLYNISLPTLDIYLAYRIAHLVPIYKSEEDSDFNTIFHQNKRIKWILPNFPEKQTISLWIKPFEWNTRTKDVLEFLWNSRLGNLFERLVKHLQKTIIRLKILINPWKNRDVIISDSMLKFHQDIREKISLKYNIKVK